MMNKVHAYLNHGRWLASCKLHPQGGVMLLNPSMDKIFVCPVCYPGVIARMTVVRNGRVITIFDRQAQKTARMMADKNGDVCEIVYPAVEKIESIVNRRKTEHRNWEPGETLKYLNEENKAHGVK